MKFVNLKAWPKAAAQPFGTVPTVATWDQKPIWGNIAPKVFVFPDGTPQKEMAEANGEWRNA